MRRIARVSGLLGLSALLAGAAAPGAPSASETARLAAGAVILELRGLPRGGPKEGVGRGVIDAPPERVFRALTDYAHWEEFMPFLERSDARPIPALPNNTIESHHLLDLPAPTGERRYTVRFTSRIEETAGGRVWHIDWRSVPGSGNLKEHRGSWALRTFAPNRTLASCTLYTDPGGLTPNFAMNRATRKMIGWIFKGLRQQVRRGRYLGG